MKMKCAGGVSRRKQVIQAPCAAGRFMTCRGGSTGLCPIGRRSNTENGGQRLRERRKGEGEADSSSEVRQGRRG